MATLVPRPPYSPTELSTLYPSSLQLEQVQVLLRHGERTPIVARFPATGIPAHWPYCSTAANMRSAVLDPTFGAFASLAWQLRYESLGPAAAPAVDNLCDMGTLTDTGRATTHNLGVRLRRLYVDRLGFLPGTLDPQASQPAAPHATTGAGAGAGAAPPAGFQPGWLYLRSTPSPRALESLQQTFRGVYPAHTTHPESAPPVIHTRHRHEETLAPNDAFCPRFSELLAAFNQVAARKWDDSPELRYIEQTLDPWLPHVPKTPAKPATPPTQLSSAAPAYSYAGAPAAGEGTVRRVGVHKGVTNMIGILDSVNSTIAHGPEVRLPEAFYGERLRTTVERVCAEAWFEGYTVSRETRMLGIGGLLGDVVARMVARVDGTSPVRLGLSGCHDTTLAAVLGSMGCLPPGQWPPFTSHIAIELFSEASAKKASLDNHYVRLRYNDVPMVVPGCVPEGKHYGSDESLCTLKAFKAIVDDFTPKDWMSQCRANLGTPGIPEKPEPSGYLP